MTSKDKIYIVTEGGSDVGMGHISRCLSFYDRFIRSQYEIEIIVDGDNDCDNLLQERKHQYIKWLNNIEQLRFIDNNIFLLDSINATQEQIDYIQKITNKLIVIDDFKRRNYYHSIIIDWTPNVENKSVHNHNSSNNILLLGLNYSILRQPFITNNKYKIKEFNEITIIMGGADVRNLTPKIANAITNHFQDKKLNIILGPSTKEFTKQNQNIHIYKSLNAEKIKNIFISSDLVISAGGQTLFELAALKIPTIPIQVVDNQIEDLKGFLELGFYKEIL